MKKIYHVCPIILLFSVFKFSYSQNANFNIEHAPQQGDICIEISFATNYMDAERVIPALRGKHYLTSNLALRAAFWYSYASNDFDVQDEFTLESNDTVVLNTYRMNYHKFHLQGGIEVRPQVQDRLSPYLGIDLGFEKKSSEYDTKEHKKSMEEQVLYLESTSVENAWLIKKLNLQHNPVPVITTTIEERSYNSFTINLFMGLDFYVFKHLYAGFELGFLLENRFYLDGIVWENGEVQTEYPSIHDIESGFNLRNLLRIGYWF
jgi:hypothetical protein